MIRAEHLSKYYGGHLALDDVSFEISQGHVYGFLGPNGAGKSTTMNIITGCLSATSGRVLIDGHDIYEEPRAAKRLIGYLPEHPPLYLNETAEDYLRFVGEAKGIGRAELKTQVDEAIEKTGIQDVRNKLISTLSKGYRQRVGIAQALLGDPGVIILDEPTVGLDPIQIIEIRQLISELGKSHTVIFSSHILSEVQALCDRIIMIAKGRLVAMGEPEELTKKLMGHGEILLSSSATEKELGLMLGALPQIEAIQIEKNENGCTVARLRSGAEDIHSVSAAVYKAFAATDRLIYEMSLRRGGLEEIFVELSESGDAAAQSPESVKEEVEA